MNPVHVVDIGAVSALGNGTEALWQGLLKGHTGISTVQRFATDQYVSKTAGCIRELDAEPDGSRVDVLVDMLFDRTQTIPPDTVLFTASTKAGIDLLEKKHRALPTSLDRLLGHQVADLISSRLGITGPRRNINVACASATVALAMGASLISRSRAESVLVCGLDLVSEFVFSGFSALKALTPQTCRPFDIGRDGLTLGEGAAYLLLMSEQCRQQTHSRSWGRIVGWGISSDAHHVTAPARNGEGLMRAIEQALRGAGVDAQALAAINAHGTGSIYNDAMELTAFGKLFQCLPPLHSVKGALGHTMGASGALEAIVGLYSLLHQCIAPTVGLDQAEPAAAGRASSRMQEIHGDCLLTTNSGFGGINASLILRGSEAS
ncbi:MAG: beta-ketoacyl-[acyl-carrier-protein] synthase family protein [Planctomycetes bacterium]|nr:beta-ketoacyl-[acyl-carrier-protein] synthase family protein [Planctomycetota bacterium]